MADSLTTQSTTLSTVSDGTVIATDDAGAAGHIQIIKLAVSADGSATVLPGDAANGLDVDVTRVGGNVTVVQGTAANLKVDASGVAVPITDNGGSVTVDGSITADTELTTADLDTGAGTDTRAVVGLVGSKSGGGALLPGDATAGLKVDLGADNDVVVSDGGNVISVDDAAGSLTVDNATISVVGSGTEAAAQRVTIATDSTGVLSVDDNGGNLSIDDGGNSITVDNATISVVGGGAEATAQRVTIANDSTGVLSVDDNGGSLTVDGTVTAANTAGDVAHDTGDSGNPVKVGAKAANALPTAVANNDRTNNISDLFGRQLTSHIDPGMQSWKSANYTTTQTGTTIWDPAAGKKIAVQYLAVSSYGTTGARVIIWFGATADTTYTAGTDQLVWAGSFAPSASAKPGMVLPLGISPVFAATADHELKITTDAGISLDITVYGYEL